MSLSSVPLPLLPSAEAPLTTDFSISNPPSTSTPISFPSTNQARAMDNASTPSVSSTDGPMSLAARKRALFQKLNGGATSASGTPDSNSSTRCLNNIRDFSDPTWMRRRASLQQDVGPSPLEAWRRRVSSVASQPPALTAQMTGSTAVDDGSAPRHIPSFPSVASRVKLAVMAFNQLDVKSPGGEIVRVGENGLRPWSRMSSSTAVTRGDVGDGTTLGEYSVNSTPFKQDDSSYFAHGRTYSGPPSPTLYKYIYPDDSFDTHPPDMISPRTELAHVIAPPKFRPSSVYSTTPLPPLEDHPDIQDDPEVASGDEDDDEDVIAPVSVPIPAPVEVEEEARPLTPPSPTPTTTAKRRQTTRGTSPILLTKTRVRPPRPASRASTPAVQAPKKAPTRHQPRAPSVSSQTTTRTVRAVPKPAPSSFRPPVSQSPAPATISRPASVARSITSSPAPKRPVLPLHTTPINLKARNPHALRTDNRPVLKPFITSARSWGPGLTSGVVNRYTDC